MLKGIAPQAVFLQVAASYFRETSRGAARFGFKCAGIDFSRTF